MERCYSADTAFVGGPVATMDSARSFSDAVAVHDGRITGVGSAAVREQVTARTEVIDLRGRLLLPGFHDAHAHPVYGGIERLRCDLSCGNGVADYLDQISDYVQAHPDVEWVLGGGWEMAAFPGGAPDRQTLDAVTAGRPAYLLNRDHHGAWVNTAALHRAGIDRNTPDPPDGRIERDSAGNPSGTLHEGATRLMEPHLPRLSADDYLAGLLEGQRYLHARGVTFWHDAIIGRYLGYDDTLDIYREADRRGLLTARVRGALWWDRARGLEQISELLQRSERSTGHKFSARTVKIMQDGVCENFTAALLQPYLSDKGSGLSFLDAELLDRAVQQLDAAGLQLHFHTVGDRAVRDVLDALQRASRRNGPTGLRHQLAHLQLVHPSDLPRFEQLGVVANIQPAWAVNDPAMTDLTLPYLGSRGAWQYPYRSLLRTGAVLASGSDWPVSEAEPMQSIHAAVNRQEYGEDEAPFLPEQALTPLEAFAAYTTGTAWANHMEQLTGSISVGKAADLVVLDRNPLELPTAELGQARVDLAMVGGEIVHQRAP